MGPKDPRGKSQVVKRSINVGGHLTSVHLEDPFWDGLKSIADTQGIPVGQLVATIDSERRGCQYANVSSAIRLFVLEHYRLAALRSPAPIK